MKLFRRNPDPHHHERALDIDYQPPVEPGEKTRRKPVLILFIILSVLLAATAQLTLKYGVDKVTKHGHSGIVLSEPATSVLRVAREPFIWIGLLLFAISAAVWIVVLSRTSLSFAYPFAAITYIVIVLFDRLILKQPVPGLRWAGVLLIATGIILVSPDSTQLTAMDEVLGVVVVNHNAGPYLARCLESVRTAAGDIRTDVVIVDNHSSDGSFDRVTERHPEVRVIRNPRNVGFARAANQGLEATDAPFVLLLNPDAEVIGGTLGALVKVARERPRAGAIGALVRNPDGTLQPSARRVPPLGEALGHAFLGPLWRDNPWTRSYTMADWDRSTEREVEWVSGSAMLLRRSALDEVGFFDEAYFMYVEDVDLCTRLRRAGWQVLFSPELEILHQIGVSTKGQRGRMAFAHSDSIYRYFCKFRSDGAGALLRPFVRVALWARALLMSAVTGGRR